MKLIFNLLLLYGCTTYCGGQLSLPGTTNNEIVPEHKFNGQWRSWYNNGQLLDSGFIQKGVPNGPWVIYYKTGVKQFVRTYSSDKWQQFQLEKVRYHPKRVSLPITQLYHENKGRAEKYITAVNTFCAQENCTRVQQEDLTQAINNNDAQEHYHPLFENGFLHGPFINYFPDGKVKDSGNYKNGLPEGIWIKWTDDKQFYWNGHYHHGVKDNEWKLYSANGRLMRILFFREGKYLWRKDLKEGVELTAEETSGF